MTSPASPKWYLCVDGGGTAVKVVAISDDGQVVRATGGPCNVKSVGARQAISTILTATESALSQANIAQIPSRFFDRVWIGIAGVLHQPDIDAFAPFAREAFGFGEADGRLRITNDGHLLASPLLRLPNVDSAIAVVAGTGSVVLAFQKTGSTVTLTGRRGGHGYLLGDEGSAYHVSRLAINRLLADDDSRISSVLSGSSKPNPRLIPLYSALLKHFDVADAPALIHKLYTPSSFTPSTGSSSGPSTAADFTSVETARKLWVAEAARVVLSYAFVDDKKSQKLVESKMVASAVVAEAVSSLAKQVGALLRGSLFNPREKMDPKRTVLTLGGGMWSSREYREAFVLEVKRQIGKEFAEVVVVDSAAEEGARALLAQGREG